MTKSEIFKAAHALAKTFVGNYRACFSLALIEVRKGIKKPFSLFANVIAKPTKEEVDAKYAELDRRFELRRQGIDPDTMKRDCVKVQVSSNVILAAWEIN